MHHEYPLIALTFVLAACGPRPPAPTGPRKPAQVSAFHSAITVEPETKPLRFAPAKATRTMPLLTLNVGKRQQLQSLPVPPGEVLLAGQHILVRMLFPKLRRAIVNVVPKSTRARAYYRQLRTLPATLIDLSTGKRMATLPGFHQRPSRSTFFVDLGGEVLDLRSGQITRPEVSLPKGTSLDKKHRMVFDGADDIWLFAKSRKGRFFYGPWDPTRNKPLYLRRQLPFEPRHFLSTNRGIEVVAKAKKNGKGGCTRLLLRRGEPPRCRYGIGSGDTDWATAAVSPEAAVYHETIAYPAIADLSASIGDNKRAGIPLHIPTHTAHQALPKRCRRARYELTTSHIPRVLNICKGQGINKRDLLVLWNPKMLQTWSAPIDWHREDGDKVVAHDLIALQSAGSQKHWLDVRHGRVFRAPLPLEVLSSTKDQVLLLQTHPSGEQELLRISPADSSPTSLVIYKDCKGGKISLATKLRSRIALRCLSQPRPGVFRFDVEWSEVLDLKSGKRWRLEHTIETLLPNGQALVSDRMVTAAESVYPVTTLVRVALPAKLPPKRPLTELLAQLSKGDTASSRAAARALAMRGPPTQAAVSALTAALGRKGASLRLDVVWALARFGAAARTASPTLLRVLAKSKDLRLRRATITALSSIAPSDPRVLKALAHLSKDKSCGGAALVALQRSGTAGLDQLLKLLLRDGPHGRLCPALRKARSWSSKHLPLLLRAMSHKNQAVRLCAVSQAHRLGEHRKLTRALVRLSADPVDAVSAVAMRARIIAASRGVLKANAIPNDARAVVSQLVERNTAAATAALLKVLPLVDKFTRGQLLMRPPSDWSPAAIALLLQRLERSRETTSRNYAIALLQRTRTPAVVKGLTKALSDEATRRGAVFALLSTCSKVACPIAAIGKALLPHLGQVQGYGAKLLGVLCGRNAKTSGPRPCAKRTIAALRRVLPKAKGEAFERSVEVLSTLCRPSRRGHRTCTAQTVPSLLRELRRRKAHEAMMVATAVSQICQTSSVTKRWRQRCGKPLRRALTAMRRQKSAPPLRVVNQLCQLPTALVSQPSLAKACKRLKRIAKPEPHPGLP